MNSLYKIVILLITVVNFVACGGSGGNEGPPIINPPDTKTLTGTAAAGAPIAGIVNVKGAAGMTASSSIGIDGFFSLDVEALTAPYILFAEGSVNGKSIKIYSAAITTGTINITPVTDFILRNAIAGAAETAFDSWTTTSLTDTALSTAAADVATMIDPLLTATGIAAGTDLLTTPFTADSTGIDAVLDALDISVSGTSATVMNTFTGSSFTDDITSTGVVGSLPLTDATDTAAVLTDADAINAIWVSLADLYLTIPSSSAITAWFDNVASGFLEDGETKNIMLDFWLLGDGPEVGADLWAVIVEPMSVAGYQKAYVTRVYYSFAGYTESFITNMVFDGTSWFWYGNQTWLEVDADSHAFMSVDGMSPNSFSTGFEIYIGDEKNYAYNNGVRSAVVTGPGLPVNGIVYAHKFPSTDFGFYDSSGFIGGSFYSISSTNTLNDAAVTSIPDNAEYSFSLCTHTPDIVSADTSLCDAVQTYTHTVMKPPLPISTLNASMFASLTNPTSHLTSAFNFGGIISVSWNKPDNTMSGEVGLGYDGIWVSSEPDDTDTATTLDTIGLPVPGFGAGLFIRVEDMWGRDFNMGWTINN